MKISHRVVILITLIVSTSYIFGIDYYDKKETKVKDLYASICLPAGISLPEITYTQVNIELSGIKYGEALNAREIAVRQSESIDALSHKTNCSKLCTQIHTNDIDTELIREQNAMGIAVTSQSAETPYSVSIKTQKDIGYSTYYKMKIHGLQNINQIDELRSRFISLGSKWHVKLKERLYFSGKIDGKIDSSQRKAYADLLLKRLDASQTGYYQDDFNKDTEAYYAYTKKINEYIIGEKGKKTNVQISFSYNEYDCVTQFAIAFPFYNEPF